MQGNGDPGLAAFAEGRSAHPEIPLAEETYLRAYRRTRPPGSPPLGGERAADFFLATACAAGLDPAWNRLRERLFPTVHGYLLRRGASRAEAESLLAELPGHLCEVPGNGEGVPRIGSYRGDSRLLTWLVVVALRLVSRRRGEGREAGPSVDPEREPAATPTPLLAAMAGERSRRFRDAIHAAWGTLTRREGLALVLRFRDGLPQKEVARLLGVGEPRVSRLLDAGLRRLRREVQSFLRETPPLLAREDILLRTSFSDALAAEMARSGPDGL